MIRIAANHAAAGIFLFVAIIALPSLAQRVAVPLDGTWSVGESEKPDSIPASFSHTVLPHRTLAGHQAIRCRNVPRVP